MLLHASNNILVKKLFGNDLVGRFSYISLTMWCEATFFVGPSPSSGTAAKKIIAIVHKFKNKKHICRE